MEEDTEKRFVYFYFMRKQPERIQSVVPAHVTYWREHDPKGYLGGPFADRSGGLITFETESLGAATSVIVNDPFVMDDLIENRWIKEWIVG